jgi:hypothetical protein
MYYFAPSLAQKTKYLVYYEDSMRICSSICLKGIKKRKLFCVFFTISIILGLSGCVLADSELMIEQLYVKDCFSMLQWTANNNSAADIYIPYKLYAASGDSFSPNYSKYDDVIDWSKIITIPGHQITTNYCHVWTGQIDLQLNITPQLDQNVDTTIYFNSTIIYHFSINLGEGNPVVKNKCQFSTTSFPIRYE